MITPVFRIFDLPKTKEFYVDWLGFTIDWEHKFGDNFPVYMRVSKGEIVLHLSEHHGDCCPGAKVIIDYSGLHLYCQELTAKDYRYYKPAVEETPWGSWTMEVMDPFCNKIVFSEAKV